MSERRRARTVKAAPRVPRRTAAAHKGDFGRILIVAGSRAMPGAATLASLGALRGGAGLVTLATPASALASIAPAVPCATFEPLPETTNGAIAAAAFDVVMERARSVDVVAIGPGLGRHAETVALVRRLVPALEVPLVLDADGLNAIAGEPPRALARSAATVLTPHPGELARLDGEAVVADAPAPRRARAEACARAFRELHAVVCLKGRGSVVTDGERTFVNPTGNPGMATGGAGDVLTGLLAALLHRFDGAFDAACCAVHLHGLAGDLAARRIGQDALIATDLLAFLGDAFRRSLAR